VGGEALTVRPRRVVVLALTLTPAFALADHHSGVHDPPLRLWPARAPPLHRRGWLTRRQRRVPHRPPLHPPDPRLCPAHLPTTSSSTPPPSSSSPASPTTGRTACRRPGRASTRCGLGMPLPILKSLIVASCRITLLLLDKLKHFEKKPLTSSFADFANVPHGNTCRSASCSPFPMPQAL
jgi:hypothetical protein